MDIVSVWTGVTNHHVNRRLKNFHIRGDNSHVLDCNSKSVTVGELIQPKAMVIKIIRHKRITTESSTLFELDTLYSTVPKSITKKE